MDDAEAPLLSATGLSKHFDGVQALRGAQFDLAPGEVHALMGENGAGKSTFGKILAGALRPDSGRILLAGRPFAPANPRLAQRAGVAMIFQELDLFPTLSVAENIAIGNHACDEGALAPRDRLDRFCRPFLDRVGLTVPARRLVGELPIGQQQLVAIARALSMEARILVMDESTSALSEDAAENLFRVIEQLKSTGVAIIYVSHKMDEIFRVCDRVTVLRDGEHIGTRRVAGTGMDELIRMMVGRDVNRRLTNASHVTPEVLLEARRVTTGVLRSVSFTLRRGEVLGLAGLVGAGRTELGRALFGLDRLRGGRFLLGGRPFAPTGPRGAMRRGVGFVPEDRKDMGLMMQMAVKENLTLATLHRKQFGGVIDFGAENADYEAMRESTRLKTATPNHPVASLSGGNQQKVLLGRWLMLDPDLVFLDDPTRGVDVGAKEDIYGLVEALAAAGKGVLMVSSELPELLRCCDRILVLNQGRLTADLVAGSTSQEEIMHFAAAPTTPLPRTG